MAESALRIRPEAAEVVSAEARAVLAMVQDEERRGRLADLIAAVEDGEVAGDDAQALEEVLELGLQSGRLRALYGPEGEQAALTLYRRLPRGRELGEAAREVTAALGALEGRKLEKVSIQALGPGAHVVTVAAEGLELSIKLDRQGARLATVWICGGCRTRPGTWPVSTSRAPTCSWSAAARSRSRRCAGCWMQAPASRSSLRSSRPSSPPSRSP